MTALLSHSCIANTKTIIDSGYSCEVRATTAIAAGEEITKQYVNPLETTALRRAKLKAGWYFDCRFALQLHKIKYNKGCIIALIAKAISYSTYVVFTLKEIKTLNPASFSDVQDVGILPS